MYFHDVWVRQRLRTLVTVGLVQWDVVSEVGDDFSNEPLHLTADKEMIGESWTTVVDLRLYRRFGKPAALYG